MATVPITVQLMDAFLGSAEGIHSIIMPDLYSSGGSKNVWIDKYARVKKILGYDNQNTTAVTTDTGASATRLRALFPYRKTSGGSVTRQLIGVFDDAVNEFEVWTSTDQGVTWTFRADFGAASINRIPDFDQYGNNLVIVDGVVAPRIWNGTTLSTAGATQSPTITAAAGAAGNLLGTYQWKLVSMIGGTRKAGSVASTALALQSLKGSLTWTADTDVTVTGYEIYRTSGTGKVFYFDSYVDGRTTAAFTSVNADLDILENRVLEEHGDAPPTGTYFVAAHKQRMWYLRTDTNPQRAYYSDPGDEDSVWSENYVNLVDAESQGDFITGGHGNFEGTLVVFQERSIWTISGTGQVIGNQVDWSRTRTNAQAGSVHRRTVVKIPAGSRYADQTGDVQTTNAVTLAYLTPLKDIRLFDGDNDVVISHPMKTTLATLNYQYRDKSWAVSDHERQEVTWCFPHGSNGEPSRAITWNYRWGVWYERDWAFACATEVDSATEAFVLLAGEPALATGGFCYKLWTGNSFNGSNINGQWMTKTLYGVNEQRQPALSHTKRWRWVDFLFETEQTATLTVEWLAGNAPDTGAALGSTTIQPGAQTLITADGSTILTADGSSIAVAQQSTLVRAFLKDATGQYLHDVGMRLRIGDTATSGSWSLEAKALAYQLLPGLQRRSQN